MKRIINIDAMERILPRVEKPARYTGGEYNAVLKGDKELNFCLCFPDVYEIGMSHLGSRIIYNVLNSRDDICCERAYAPWVDMERQMRDNRIELFSIESCAAVASFDVIGFSLLYELCYSNILTMLDLAGIPRFSRDRGEDVPLVICGGPCICNTEPVADFFDCALFGDGEELILDFATAYMSAKARGLSRHDTLVELSHVEGVYVPAFYTPEYDGNRVTALKKNEPSAPDSIRRRVVKNLDRAQYVGKFMVPNISIVHDRVPLELFRGCTRGCRFCQAGFIYRPVRERTMETLCTQAYELVNDTGYDEVSLFSLSSGDYSKIHELAPVLANEFSKKRVSLALPSLRIDSFLKESLKDMAAVRKSSLTFAPEAGTQRLRDVINKGVTEENLLESARDAFSVGYSAVKLYFMIGLPAETDEDVLGIVTLAKKVVEEFYKIPKDQRERNVRVSVSVSSFVPKPFTPFQWAAQDTLEELQRKQSMLREAFHSLRSIDFAYHDPYVSTLEAVFAKGDRRMSKAISAAYDGGARFDAWDEHFLPELWDESIKAAGIDRADIAHRERDVNELLPWSHMDALVTADYLRKEYAKAHIAQTTQDCRKGCNGCFGKSYENYCKPEKE